MTGTRLHDGDPAQRARNPRADDAMLAAPSAATPYWLLWPTGIAAAVLGIAAFALWVTNGAAMLFDMIVALCT
jgi:hypothetical protein